MRTSANDLSQRINKLHVESNINTIVCLMRELNISIGQIVEYADTHVNETVSTAERLREISQTRKLAQERLKTSRANIQKAQQARKAKREALLEKAQEAKKEVELNIEPVQLSLALDDINLDELTLGESDE